MTSFDDGSFHGPSYSTQTVMRALAMTGLRTQWMKLFPHPEAGDPEEVPPAFLAALWEHSPDEAERLAGAAERWVNAPDPLWGHTDLETRTKGYAELVLVIGAQAPERVPPLLRPLWDAMTMRGPWSQFLSAKTYVAAKLLVGGLDPDQPQRLPDIVDRLDLDAYSPPGPAPQGLVALVYAACGDYERAEDMLAQLDDEWDEPSARAAMAASILGLPWLPSLERDESALVRGCVDLVMPRPPADAARITRAREQLRRALMCEDGWHRALPVLAHLDPDAVRRVRDVVFAHIGLEVSPEPPPPAPA